MVGSTEACLPEGREPIEILDSTLSSSPSVANSLNLLDELLVGDLAALSLPSARRRHWCLVLWNVKGIL